MPGDQTPPISQLDTLEQPSALVASSFGRYRLLQRLGEGGMGEIWLAEQIEPVRRQVAIKVIKAGMDSAQVIARFEAERQALALMDHPAIATVFDGGTTPQGRPYFAMEYVKGEPITAYCDRHRLSTAERLELFTQVCEGVQHAHQKGIIHRDLKPSNVLVTIQDDHPAPKIIDFGVAKAMTQRLTERSLFTELGVLIGTPEYMSPEQAEMGGLNIDTRTDIYALGVLLYELLTGALPFDREDLRKAGLAEVQRIIREKEPARPSTRITQPGPASAEAAKNRHTEPKKLVSELRGDLDWITMRALEKDRTRRYQTANALAGDVRRHLNNEPVSAGPPSAVYRARKFVRRHRFGVAGAMTLLVLLAAFAVAIAVQVNQAGVDLELDQRSLLAAKVRHVSEWIVQFRSSTRALVRTLATSLAIDAPADYKKRVESLGAKRTLEAFQRESSSLVSVNVVDRNGFGAKAGVGMPEPALGAGIQAALLAGLRGESTSSTPFWSTTLSEPIVIHAEPVLASDGTAQAVVIAVSTLEPMVRVIRGSGEGGILDVYVVTSDGKLVAHSDPKFASTGADMKRIDIVQEFVQTAGRAAFSMPFALKDSTGVTRQMLGTVVRVADDSGWGVIAQIAEAKAYAGANSMRRDSIIVVSVVSLLALGLVLLLFRWVI